MVEPEVFRKQMYCFENGAFDICCDFAAPRNDSASGELSPLAPLIMPLVLWNKNRKNFQK